jgi:hypothetical protein
MSRQLVDAWIETTPTSDPFHCTFRFPNDAYCNAPARYRGLKRNRKYKAVVYYKSGSGEARCGLHAPKVDS